jgi:hypothetical protein
MFFVDKEPETFWGHFDPIRKQKWIDVKLSAIVQPKISSHPYKFQLDQSDFAFIIDLNSYVLKK